jgi:ketosteroid isomerase-like protein
MRRTTLVLSTLLAATAIGCTPSPTAQLEANKDLVRRFTEALNAADWDALDALLTEDFIRYSQATAGPQVNSREEFIQLQESFLGIAELWVEWDNVAMLTQLGLFPPPSG